MTDLHYRNAVPGTSAIAKRRCRDARRYLERALDLLSAADVALVLCTGDLVDDPGHPAAIQDLEDLGELFDSLGVDSLILPGNHDPHPDTFYQVFQRPPRSFGRHGVEVLAFGEDHVAPGERASLRSDLVLGEMREILSVRSDASWTVLAQHYLVYPERNQGYPHNYGNDAEIQPIMERSQRRMLSISGHYHPGVAVSRHCGIDYFVGSALCEAPHPCYLIELGESHLTVKEYHCAEGI